MPHSWVFEVLADLKTYAVQNDLPDLARKVEEAILAAEVEIMGGDEGDGPSDTFVTRAAALRESGRTQ